MFKLILDSLKFTSRLYTALDVNNSFYSVTTRTAATAFLKYLIYLRKVMLLLCSDNKLFLCSRPLPKVLVGKVHPAVKYANLHLIS